MTVHDGNAVAPRVVTAEDDAMKAVVQLVSTSWTKQSRGGAAATRRNAAPIAFPLPALPPPFTHEVLIREHDGFQPQFTIREGLPESAPDPAIHLEEADGRLRVQLNLTPFGTPRRWRRPPARRLAHGDWLRWQINYRFEDSNGEWTYRLDTLNIAYGPTPADLFLGTPTHHVDELASLR